MTDKLGGGGRMVFDSRLTVTGVSKIISQTGFEIFNSNSFPDLTYIYSPCPCISYNSITGEFLFNTSGVLTLSAAININALQASAELSMVPEFNFGSGWVVGVPRKEVFVAIQMRQLTWSGEISIIKGTRLRFCFKGASGNLRFETQTIDQGGPLEAILPATVLYIKILRKVMHKFH